MTGNDYGASHSLDSIVEQMRTMQGCIDDMSRKLDSMYVMQRIDDDILRKSANSINVIVRLLAGCCRLENQDLWNTLILSGALLDNVRPSMDLGFDHIPMSHSKLQHLKFILQDLTRVLESPENTEAANSTPNNNSDNYNIPSTSTQNKMHCVSPISSAFSSEGQSTSDVTSNADMAENTHYISYNDNNSIALDGTSVHNISTVAELQDIQNIQATSKTPSTSESEMFSDSCLIGDIKHENHNDNSITSDRTSVHNNTATIIGGLQEVENSQATSKIQSSSESAMLPNSSLTDDIEHDNHNDNLITSDKTFVHKDTATIIGGPQEIEHPPAISQIQNTSASKMFPDSCSIDIERDNSNVNSTFFGMTPIHARFIMRHPAANLKLVESEEARMLRRKYKNKYNYIERLMNINKKVTSNVSSGVQVKTKTSIDNRCLYEPRLILNKFRMTDPYNNLKKTKASGSNQTNSEDWATTKNSTNLDKKRKCNNDGVGGSNSARKSATNRNKDKKRSVK